MNTPKHDPRLERLRKPMLPAAERERIEAELLSDPESSEALYADLNLEAALADAARAPRALRGKRRLPRGLAIGLPLAATLALLWLGPRWGELTRVDGPPRFRGETTRVHNLAPEGALDATPRQFAWNRDAEAERYRFELYDADSRLLHSAVVVDTSYALPVGASGASSGFWRITPVSPQGRELLASEPVHFHQR